MSNTYNSPVNSLAFERHAIDRHRLPVDANFTDRSGEREITGEVLARAVHVAINGTTQQIMALAQLCALEGI